jgi:outer membrane protein assembly factor BamB
VKLIPTCRAIFCTLAATCFLTPLFAQDDAEFAANWPSFRGPTANGTSTTATPPVEWDEETGKNIAWKVELAGSGNNSSPVVWGDRVFVLTSIPTAAGGEEQAPKQEAPRRRRGGGGGGSAPVMTRFVTLCYDRNSGKLLWEQVATEAVPHQGTHGDHSFASASPCTDGRHVYSHFGSRGLFCYDMDGKLVWKRDDFGQMQTRNGFGEGSSPFLHGDIVVVPWDHEGDSYVIALNALTGETLWKKDRDEPSNWVTPVVVKHAGREILVTGGENRVRGYDLKSGEELWQAAGPTSRPIASPVVFGNHVVLSSARQGFFLASLDASANGDLSAENGINWSTNENGSDVPSLLLSGKRLYFLKGSNGILSCMDVETGENFYEPRRLPDVSGVYASPVAANGFVFIVSREGVTLVLEDSESFKVVATNRLNDRIDATPALAGKQMFLRGKKTLYCIQGE